MTCHLVCASPLNTLQLEPAAGDLVVACDGGYELCLQAGIQPDLLLGDFDSLPGGKPASVPCECVELPWEKDDTDLMAALRICLERGQRDFCIHNVLGGDEGHTFAAVYALAWLRAQGAQGVLYGGGQAIALVLPADGEVVLSSLLPAAAEPGTRVSVFAFGGSAQGLRERGLHWETDGLDLGPLDSIGVSNQVERAGACVQIDAGALLVVLG